MPARNAKVRILNGGKPVAVPAANGRSLDVQATINKIASAPDSELADGALDLIMVTTSPTVTDASGLVEKARAMLTAPLKITAYDPIQNQGIDWTVPTDQWSQWLTTQNGASGITFALDGNALTNYLSGQNGSLADARTLAMPKTAPPIQPGTPPTH